MTKQSFSLLEGENQLLVDWSSIKIETTSQYGFICFQKNEFVKIPRSKQRVTGMLTVFNTINKAVSNYGKQTPTEDIGVDEFEFWTARRRPMGHNLALCFKESLQRFSARNVTNGIARPTTQTNAWVAALDDKEPFIELEWAERQQISKIELSFDTDFDHPMESVLMTHPENVMPFCVREYQIFDDNESLVYEKKDNYQTRNSIRFENPINTQKLRIKLVHPDENIPASLFEIRCYQ